MSDQWLALGLTLLLLALAAAVIWSAPMSEPCVPSTINHAC